MYLVRLSYPTYLSRICQRAFGLDTTYSKMAIILAKVLRIPMQFIAYDNVIPMEATKTRLQNMVPYMSATVDQRSMSQVSLIPLGLEL
jgi:hypothetical protein